MNDSSPENLQSLAQTDLINLPDSFSHEAQTGGEKYILFNLDEKLYAVSARQVIEVIQPLITTPLPKVPEWFSGIFILRGKIISVINLPRLWGSQLFGCRTEIKTDSFAFGKRRSRYRLCRLTNSAKSSLCRERRLSPSNQPTLLTYSVKSHTNPKIYICWTPIKYIPSFVFVWKPRIRIYTFYNFRRKLWLVKTPIHCSIR